MDHEKIGMRMLVCAGILIAGAACCGPASAGPLDNANEAIEAAVSNAEANNDQLAQRSGDNDLISWAGQESGSAAAVNTGTTGSADAQ